MMINKVVQTKRNNHLYGADESPSVRAVPPHLFFISLSPRFSFSVSLPIITTYCIYPILFLLYYNFGCLFLRSLVLHTGRRVNYLPPPFSQLFYCNTVLSCGMS